jgi:hypothetical protein
VVLLLVVVVVLLLVVAVAVLLLVLSRASRPPFAALSYRAALGPTKLKYGESITSTPIAANSATIALAFGKQARLKAFDPMGSGSQVW